MDIRMPGGDGIEATCGILGDPGSAGCRVLVLSMFELDEYVYGALRAGASGFLLKDCEPDRLLEAVRRIHDGESLFAPVRPDAVGRPLRRAPGARPRAPARAAHPARGRGARPGRARPLEHEIAAHLVISVKTVKTHVGSLLAKLHARDRAQLVIAAYEAGVVARDRA